MIHDSGSFQTAGLPLVEATKVMVMVHGRGGNARDMLSISNHIQNKDFAFIAPEAQNNTWYPHSFLQPLANNEPYLSSALETLAAIRARLQADFNFKLPQIYWLGFSQGACLTLEFVARNAAEYGGVFGLSGGLIGPAETPRNYEGTLSGTPIFLGCSNNDSHVPEQRVLESEEVFKRMNARVTTKLYPNFPHTINEDELNIVNLLIAGEQPRTAII